MTWTVTFDCGDARRLAAFWCLALDYEPAPPPSGFDTWEAWLHAFAIPEEEWNDGTAIHDPTGAGPRISFLKVPEPKTAKNRVHLDIQAGGGRHVPLATRWPLVETKAAQLVAAGATFVAVVSVDDEPDHVVLTDPEGNEFCVL